ncbi:cytochrome P450 monooxygenase [Hypoxylon fragiforme]|uniref:cytochrome P450 monooxygenase n=1 Tax=Hypoxylon fragiforme TaxID=63214 RepID=UPI0020C69226|nr:cytochrome P450 monooxygenase [Hypoxylon fragiforme]KAI2610041.1 cytochrome P450 monooxygenase [Hypoxylon fragiforme]
MTSAWNNMSFSHFQLPDTATICYLGIAAIFTYVFSTAIYNRYFHPLAKFPGPFLGSLTSWYLVHVICSVPTYGLELHKKYGPIVRLAPNLLSFSDATLLPHVYHRSADKPAFYASWMFGKTAAMFQSLKHEDHYAKKKLVAPCCSMTAMKANHERKISERIDEFCSKIQKKSASGMPLDFSEHLRWFLTDVWTHLVYGEPRGCVTQDRDVDGLLGSLQGVYGMSAEAAVMPFLTPLLQHPLLRKYVWSHTKTFKHMDNLFSNFEKMLARRKHDEKLQNQKLFFDDIDPSKNPQEPHFSPTDFKAEVITFTAATLDGVSAFISPFLDNLLTHPSAHARVVAEILAADRAGRLSSPVATYDETTRLPFFTACIKETLRRDAPAQTILPRVVSAPGYALLRGTVHVPPGAQMGASPYIVHRDAAVFGADPDAWRPQRWVPGESGMMDAGEHDAYVRRMEKYGMWWGYGDRECTGKYYAQMEMQKLCVEIFRRFEVKRPVGGEGFTHKRWAVGMFWGQRLVFKARER